MKMNVFCGLSAVFLCCFIFHASLGHPTIYRYNEDKNLEPALIPVSSTVIPLAAYEVGYGFRVRDVGKKAGYPPETLITVNTKKRIYEKEKQHNEKTIV